MAGNGKTRDLNDAMGKYKAEGLNDFFQLKDDGDTATVRILTGANLEPEVDWFIVHGVQIKGKKRWVQCTEDGDCPLCQKGMRPILKVFLQLEDTRDGKIKTWERGQKTIPQLQELLRTNGSLCNRLYEIERKGKAGDENTVYEFHPFEPDETSYEDVEGQRQQLLGENSFILQKSIADMKLMAEGRYVPPAMINNDGSGGGAPASGEQASLDASAPPARRERGGQDVF